MTTETLQSSTLPFTEPGDIPQCNPAGALVFSPYPAGRSSQAINLPVTSPLALNPVQAMAAIAAALRSRLEAQLAAVQLERKELAEQRARLEKAASSNAPAPPVRDHFSQGYRLYRLYTYQFCRLFCSGV